MRLCPLEQFGDVDPPEWSDSVSISTYRRRRDTGHGEIQGIGTWCPVPRIFTFQHAQAADGRQTRQSPVIHVNPPREAGFVWFAVTRLETHPR